MKNAILSLLTLLSLSLPAFADMPASHGMLIFGKNATYASHLPMFHQPHDYQVILKLSLADGHNAQTLAAYEQLKAAGETFFTIDPQTMDLTKIISGVKTQFHAILYKGHFEKGGEEVGPVLVTVQKVLFSQKLDPNSDIPKMGDKYFVFGEKQEYYSAHVITGATRFDAISEVEHVRYWTEGPCKYRTCGGPVLTPIADTSLPMGLYTSKLSSPEAGDVISDNNSQTSIIKNIYVETDELAN